MGQQSHPDAGPAGAGVRASWARQCAPETRQPPVGGQSARQHARGHAKEQQIARASRTHPAGEGTIAVNRRARHEFSIEDTIEVGLVLTGTEIKSIRAGHVSLQEAFARMAWWRRVPAPAEGAPIGRLLHRKQEAVQAMEEEQPAVAPARVQPTEPGAAPPTPRPARRPAAAGQSDDRMKRLLEAKRRAKPS